jgi:hypothetical protein
MMPHFLGLDEGDPFGPWKHRKLKNKWIRYKKLILD